MGYLRKVLRYGAISAGVLGTVGVAASLKSNQYNLDSIGIVRFGRASFAVSVSSLNDEKVLNW